MRKIKGEKATAGGRAAGRKEAGGGELDWVTTRRRRTAAAEEEEEIRTCLELDCSLFVILAMAPSP